MEDVQMTEPHEKNTDFSEFQRIRMGLDYLQAKQKARIFQNDFEELRHELLNIKKSRQPQNNQRETKRRKISSFQLVCM